MPPTTTPYTVPKWNPQTGEGSLTYLSNKTGTPIADILKANAGNAGIYYQGTDPRLREGAVLNMTAPIGGAKTTAGPGISSTSDYRGQIDQTAGKINEFANDPYMSLFENARLAGTGAEDTARLEARAKSAKFEKGAIDESNRYKAGLETAGIMSGISQYAPTLQADRIHQAQTEVQAKLQDIDNEERLALAKAKQARTENDLSIMKEQLDYVQALRKAKADAISEANKLSIEKERSDRDYELKKSIADRNYALDVQKEGRLAKGGSIETTETPGNIDGLNAGFGWLFSQPDVTQDQIDLYNSDPVYQQLVLEQAMKEWGLETTSTKTTTTTTSKSSKKKKSSDDPNSFENI